MTKVLKSLFEAKKVNSINNFFYSFSLIWRFDKNFFLKIDVVLDKAHITNDNIYIKREEDFKIDYLKGLKEVSHAEIYKSAYSLIVHIKSLQEP